MDIESASIAVITAAKVNPKLKGFRFLVEALKIGYENPEALTMVTKILYPEIGKRFGVRPDAVERSIRSAIKTTSSPQTNSAFINGCVWFMRQNNIVGETPKRETVKDLYIKLTEPCKVIIVNNCKKCLFDGVGDEFMKQKLFHGLPVVDYIYDDTSWFDMPRLFVRVDA